MLNSPLNSAKFGNSNIQIQEIPFATSLDLRINPSSKGFKIIEKTLGVKLPNKVGKTFRSKKFTILKLKISMEKRHRFHSLKEKSRW